MKTMIIAVVAAFALAGTGVASAETVNARADVKAGSVKADTKASVNKRKHRSHATTGIGIETRDNNASARGSLLPGKDRLTSRAWIENQ